MAPSYRIYCSLRSHNTENSQKWNCAATVPISYSYSFFSCVGGIEGSLMKMKQITKGVMWLVFFQCVFILNDKIFETTKTGTETSFGTIRNKTFVSVFFGSIPKQRILVFGLNRNKQKINRTSVIESIFWYFFKKLTVVLVCFETVFLFQLFRYRFETPKENRKCLFLVSRNKPKHNRNRFCFGMFRFEPKFCFCFEDTLV